MSISQSKRISFFKRVLASHDQGEYGPDFRDEEGAHGYAATRERKERSEKSFREMSGLSKDDLKKLLKDEDIKAHVLREWNRDLLKEDKLTEEKLREYMGTYSDREKIKAVLDSVDYSGTNPLFSRTSEE